MSDKILIVDDDREIRDVLRILLTGERFEVAEASGGEEALAYLAEHPGGVDLVILDVMMDAFLTMRKIPLLDPPPFLEYPEVLNSPHNKAGTLTEAST